MRLISIGFALKIYLVDVVAPTPRIPELIDILGEKVLIAHNARFYLLTLRVKYGCVQGRWSALWLSADSSLLAGMT